MITLNKFLKTVDYRVLEGSPYSWNCFGPNSRIISCGNYGEIFEEWGASIVFNTKTLMVYQVEAHDFTQMNKVRSWRWVHPKCEQSLKDEYKMRGFPYKRATESNNFIECRDTDKILEAIDKLRNKYDKFLTKHSKD